MSNFKYMGVRRKMKDIQLKISRENASKDGKNGFKIIEVKVSDPTESLFSVVTPIKKQ